MSAPYICSPLTTVCYGRSWWRFFTPREEAFQNTVERVVAGGVRVE